MVALLGALGLGSAGGGLAAGAGGAAAGGALGGAATGALGTGLSAGLGTGISQLAAGAAPSAVSLGAPAAAAGGGALGGLAPGSVLGGAGGAIPSGSVLPTGAIGQLAAGVNPLDVGLSASGGGGNFLTDLLGEVGQNISMNLSDFKEDPIGFAKDKGMELISRRIQDALSGEGQQPQQSPQLLASMPTLPSVAAGPTAKAPLSLSSLLATTGPKKPGSGTALGLNNLAFERAAGSLPERLA